MNPIVIVGAGITGCVAGRELARKGAKVILIERDDQVGGLSRTFSYGDSSFDIGPHRFYSNDGRIRSFILETLGDDCETILRRSEVYFFKKYHPWPLRPAVLFNLPASVMLKSAFDLGCMALRSRKGSTESFEDYILANYGPSLYNAFFRDYTQKFLGLDPRSIHADWAREGMRRTIIDESIASRDLFDILKLFFFFKPLQTEFIYPGSGTGEFCRNLAGQILGSGGQILTSQNISSILRSGTRIDAVVIGKETIPVSHLIWTGSLKDACGLLGESCRGLDYLSLLVFNVVLNRPARRDFQWCYYGSRDVIFSRISIPQFFNRKMTPEGKGGLCVEVTCRKDDQYWRNPESLLEAVKRDLCRVGICGAGEIEAVHIEKVAEAYPIYTPGYQDELAKVKDSLGRFVNFLLAGRTGLFWYNNMDESIGNGLKVAQGLSSEMKLAPQLC